MMHRRATIAVAVLSFSIGACARPTPEPARVASLTPAPAAADVVAPPTPTFAPTPATTAATAATVSTTRPPTVVPTTDAHRPTTIATISSTTVPTTTLAPVPRQPLTGEPLGANAPPVERPALVVKIDNAPPARRNQSGLAVADIVFEEIVEGDVTRFAAVFHSRGSEVVGPIRSGRTQDIDLFSSFETPLLAWSGGNPGVTEMIANGPFVDLNAVGDGEGYYRGAGRAPHDLYNSTERLWAQSPPGHPGPSEPQFRYLRPEEPFGGDLVVGFDLAMRGVDVGWRWDGGRDEFVRFQSGEPHLDVEHGSIGAANVVVMVVEYRPSVVDARSPEAQTVGQGPAFLFARGRVAEGRWWRESAADPIKFVALDGATPLALVPGNTWIELAEADVVDSLLAATTELTILPLG